MYISRRPELFIRPYFYFYKIDGKGYCASKVTSGRLTIEEERLERKRFAWVLHVKGGRKLFVRFHRYRELTSLCLMKQRDSGSVLVTRRRCSR